MTCCEITKCIADTSTYNLNEQTSGRDLTSIEVASKYIDIIGKRISSRTEQRSNANADVSRHWTFVLAIIVSTELHKLNGH